MSEHDEAAEVFGARVFFGDPWDAPACDYARQAATPVGEQCLYCTEQIVEGDRGWFTAVISKGKALPAFTHIECEMLATMGHTYDVCSCTGYGHDRAAARELWRRVGVRRGRPLEDLSVFSPWRRTEDGRWEHAGRRKDQPAAGSGDTRG